MDFHADIVSELASFFTSLNPNISIEKIAPPIPMELITAVGSVDRNKIEVKNKSHRLLERLLTYKRKHISRIKRDVIISDDLQQKLNLPDYVHFSSVIEEIKIDFQNGNDLNWRLSKRADDPTKNDAMLFEWNMYHLHLGTERERHNNNYCKRTGELLVVYITDSNTTAYFIDITENHRNNPIAFSRQRYLDILNSNWPNLLSKYELQEVQMESHITDEERSILRKANAIAFNNIAGKTFLNPGLGVTSAGTSIQICRKTDFLIQYIDDVESFCRNYQKQYLPKQIPEYLNYRLKFNEKYWSFYIVEYLPSLPKRIVLRIPL